MAARRLELGMRTWKALADRAGVSYETVRALKAGSTIREDSVFAIERALCWRAGSIRRILDGGEPIQGVATARADLGMAARATGEGRDPDREWKDRIIAEGAAEAAKVLEGMDRKEAEELMETMRTYVAGWRALRAERGRRRRDAG